MKLQKEESMVVDQCKLNIFKKKKEGKEIIDWAR